LDLDLVKDQGQELRKALALVPDGTTKRRAKTGPGNARPTLTP